MNLGRTRSQIAVADFTMLELHQSEFTRRPRTEFLPLVATSRILTSGPEPWPILPKQQRRRDPQQYCN